MKGVGAKKLGMSLETQGTKLLGGIFQIFAGKDRVKKVYVQFSFLVGRPLQKLPVLLQ